MKRADRFGDDERCRDGADKRDRDGLAREVVAPAFIAANSDVGGIFTRHALLVGHGSGDFIRRRIGPEFRDRTRVRKRVEADGIEIIRRSSEAALDGPQKLRCSEITTREVRIKTA
jgi:hypothetical protein